MKIELHKGDCLEVMQSIPDASVDMILCDLPYGTTACKWDTVIPFEPLWAQYRRIAKKNAAIVLTASQPFTSVLVSSWLGGFKHGWVWNKKIGANFGVAKYQPMKIHEDVLVFCRGTAPYVPLMTQRDKPIVHGANKCVSESSSIARAKPEYDRKVYTEKFPESILVYPRERGLHPTQKPVALMEYLIRTYTNEGDTVLDNCMGSGTTGVACVNTDRSFIGIEQDEKYFEIAKLRIGDA